MKIAYLSFSVLPSRAANSVHVMRMCAAYAALGHEVIVFAPDRRSETEKGVTDVFAYYGVPPSFQIRLLPWPAIRLRSLWYSIHLRRALRAFQPDLIHSRYLLGSALAARGAAISLFEFHAPVREGSRWQGVLLRWLCHRGALDGLVVVTQALARHTMEEKLLPGDRICTAPDAADAPVENMAAFAYPGAGKKLQVGYVGQLYAGKGLEVLETLAPRAPQVDFHVIGGSERDIAFWKGRIGASNVFFHGFVPPGMAASYIAGLDVCLLPNQLVVRTFTNRKRDAGDIGAYTSPLKLFEYMSHGKAIVASKLSVLEEILDGTMALLADPEKPEEWRDCLERLEDRPLRIRLGQAAREAFLARHTWKARAAQIESFVERLGKSQHTLSLAASRLESAGKGS